MRIKRIGTLNDANNALLRTSHKVRRPENADVLLRNTMINEWRYSDDDR